MANPGEERLHAALTELGVERAHARLRLARERQAASLGPAASLGRAPRFEEGLGQTSGQWPMRERLPMATVPHPHQGGLSGFDAGALADSDAAELSPRHLRVLEALQLQQRLEGTLALVANAKATAAADRPREGTRGSFEPSRAAAIKLLEC